MKFTKRILAVCLLALCALMFGPAPAQAQSSGVKTIFSSATMLTLTTNQALYGGITNYLGAPGNFTNITSTNIILSCGDYDYMGLTWKFTGISSTTNGAIVLRAFRSYDNGTSYEMIPGYTLTTTPPTATSGVFTYVNTTNIDVHGATHVAFSFVNLANDYITNESFSVNYKIPKVGAVSATR